MAPGMSKFLNSGGDNDGTVQTSVKGSETGDQHEVRYICMTNGCSRKARKKSKRNSKTQHVAAPVNDTFWDSVRMTDRYYAFFENDPASTLSTIIPLSEISKPTWSAGHVEDNRFAPFGSMLIPFFAPDKVATLNLGELSISGISKEHALISGTSLDICAVCGIKASSKCQGCLSVGYCSREHQKQAWKMHRPHCVLHEVISDSEGHAIIAKHNIKKGEAIFIERPYFVTPYSADEHFGLINFQPVSQENSDMPIGRYTIKEYQHHVCELPPVCLGCNAYLHTDRSNVVPCQVCGWPTCGTNCEGLESHRRLECAFLLEKGLKYDECHASALLPPRVYGMIRGLLLKEKDPEKWNIISEANPTWDEELKALPRVRINLEYILIVLQTVFGFKDITYQDLVEVYRLVDTKGAYGSLVGNFGDGMVRRITGVYHNASLLRHKCVGNVMIAQTYPPALHVVATENIKRGEILTRSYCRIIDSDLNRGFGTRQRFLRTDGFLKCNCEFCTNVTDDDKIFSAIVCLKCKRRGVENHMLIENATDEYSPWKCSKCGAIKTASQARTLFHRIVGKLEELTVNRNMFEYEYQLRNLIGCHKSVDLHPGNSIIIAAECDLIYVMMSRDRLDSMTSLDLDELHILLSARVKNLATMMSDVDSNIISVKMRLALVIFHQAIRISTNKGDVLKRFDEIQAIHDQVAACFVGNTVKNVFQGYIYSCLEQLKELLDKIKLLFCTANRRGLKRPLRYTQADNV